MGCNFYTLTRKHIGKRSAAGLYCWDCKVTLCKEGTEKVHYSTHEWYDKCPQCGKQPQKETLENGAAGRELGFNKSKSKAKTGVASCASFSWAVTLDKLGRLKYLKDEYGRRYSINEFKDVLEECPIHYHDMIGRDFS